ncbi:MAG: hypothetical protein CVV47_01430 [Spirochaetae bacterium HGW-Spirochaetae-3]|jgi:hypothetical protein|nr:MAG: hypothetical protein CVV47_01430 [Spirochaetae bacterium HGW-Spirochaetae-3]
MSIREYLSGTFFEIQAYKSDPPQDALAFTGSPRKHPYDDGKIILIEEPKDGDSAIYEFKAADVVGAQDLPSPVTEAGESYRIVRLWIRRGSIGIKYEPFEVESPLRFMAESHVLKDKLFGRHRG